MIRRRTRTRPCVCSCVEVLQMEDTRSTLTIGEARGQDRWSAPRCMCPSAKEVKDTGARVTHIQTYMLWRARSGPRRRECSLPRKAAATENDAAARPRPHSMLPSPSSIGRCLFLSARWNMLWVRYFLPAALVIPDDTRVFGPFARRWNMDKIRFGSSRWG